MVEKVFLQTKWKENQKEKRGRRNEKTIENHQQKHFISCLEQNPPDSSHFSGIGKLPSIIGFPHSKHIRRFFKQTDQF